MSAKTTKKVLFVASVESHIAAFHIPYLQHFLEEGCEVHVAALRDNKDMTLDGLNIVFHPVDFARTPYSKDTVKAYRQIKALLHQYRFDLIHTHTPVASLLVRMAARNLPQTKMIYTAHGFHFYKGAPLLNWLVYYPFERLTARYTDALITINREDYCAARHFKMRENGQVFYVHGVGVDISRYGIHDSTVRTLYRKQMGIAESDFVIICVAELIERKNQMQLIQAMEQLRQENIVLLLVGVGASEKKLKDYVKSHHMEKHVRLLGFRQDIPELLSMSDCISLVSRVEGLPRSLMEGMAAGLVPLGTNSRGIRDMITHRKTGYLFPYGNVQATAKCIRYLSGKGPVLAKMSRLARKRIEPLELENVMKEMQAIYGQIAPEIYKK